jgi:hypothetical protein
MGPRDSAAAVIRIVEWALLLTGILCFVALGLVIREGGRWGMRDSQECAHERTPGTVRILGLGDSGMFGWAVHQDSDYLSVSDEVAGLCREAGLAFFNTLSVPAGKHPGLRLHGIHPDSGGHAVLAGYLEEALRSRGWLQPSSRREGGP